MADKFILPDEIHNVILDFDKREFSINDQIFGKSCQKFSISIECGKVQVSICNADNQIEEVEYKRALGAPIAVRK